SPVENAISNISILEKILYAGVLALGVSTAYQFWGESALGASQLLAAAVLFFSPFILSTAGIATSTKDRDPVAAAMQAINHGGILLGLIALVVIGIDLTARAK